MHIPSFVLCKDIIFQQYRTHCLYRDKVSQYGFDEHSEKKIEETLKSVSTLVANDTTSSSLQQYATNQLLFNQRSYSTQIHRVKKNNKYTKDVVINDEKFENTNNDSMDYNLDGDEKKKLDDGKEYYQVSHTFALPTKTILLTGNKTFRGHRQ